MLTPGWGRAGLVAFYRAGPKCSARFFDCFRVAFCFCLVFVGFLNGYPKHTLNVISSVSALFCFSVRFRMVIGALFCVVFCLGTCSPPHVLFCLLAV